MSISDSTVKRSIVERFLQQTVQNNMYLTGKRVLGLVLLGTFLDELSTYLYIYKHGLAAWQVIEANHYTVFLSTKIGAFALIATSPIEIAFWLLFAGGLFYLSKYFPIENVNIFILGCRFIMGIGPWVIILFLFHVPTSNFYQDIISW